MPFKFELQMPFIKITTYVKRTKSIALLRAEWIEEHPIEQSIEVGQLKILPGEKASWGWHETFIYSLVDDPVSNPGLKSFINSNAPRVQSIFNTHSQAQCEKNKTNDKNWWSFSVKDYWEVGTAFTEQCAREATHFTAALMPQPAESKSVSEQRILLEDALKQELSKMDENQKQPTLLKMFFSDFLKDQLAIYTQYKKLEFRDIESQGKRLGKINSLSFKTFIIATLPPEDLGEDSAKTSEDVDSNASDPDVSQEEDKQEELAAQKSSVEPEENEHVSYELDINYHHASHHMRNSLKYCQAKKWDKAIKRLSKIINGHYFLDENDNLFVDENTSTEAKTTHSDTRPSNTDTRPKSFVALLARAWAYFCSEKYELALADVEAIKDHIDKYSDLAYLLLSAIKQKIRSQELNHLWLITSSYNNNLTQITQTFTAGLYQHAIGLITIALIRYPIAPIITLKLLSIRIQAYIQIDQYSKAIQDIQNLLVFASSMSYDQFMQSIDMANTLLTRLFEKKYPNNTDNFSFQGQQITTFHEPTQNQASIPESSNTHISNASSTSSVTVSTSSNVI